MDYSQHMLARAEHERMAKSVPKVPEYGYNVVEHRSRQRRLPTLRMRSILITILHLLTK